MTNNPEEPSFTELRHEAQATMHLTTSQQYYFDTALEILSSLERRALEYGEQRMVQLSDDDLSTLRSALMTLRGAR